MINYKKLTVALICGTILTFPIAGCGLTAQTTENTAATTQQGITLTSSQSVADTSGLTLEFDEEDTVTSYDSTTASYVTLSQNGSTVKRKRCHGRRLDRDDYAGRNLRFIRYTQ